MFKKGDKVICVKPAYGLVYGRKYKITYIDKEQNEHIFVDIIDCVTNKTYEDIYVNRFELNKSKKSNKYNY